jgi:hypothetical protein
MALALKLGAGIIVFILTLALAPARAADNAALALFEKGEYVAAAQAAAAQGDAPGLALAARATLAEATLRETPCMPCLQRAETFARRALAADANLMEAHIHLAVSLGYQARIIGPIRARFQRFPEQAKDSIEIALRLAPNSHWALSAAGGFNIEVVRSGGRFLGDLLYGATFENGVSYFHRAMDADPENPTIKLQYALALTGYDFDSRREEIMAMLDACMKVPSGNVYEQTMKERAGRLLGLLHQNKREEYLQLARRYQGYPVS